VVEEALNKEWEELLDFVQGKQIVGVAVSDDEADFDLIFEDGSRLELYAMMAEDDDGVAGAYIDWALTEAGEADDEDDLFSDNGHEDD
jgi:hypothetical protein